MSSEIAQFKMQNFSPGSNLRCWSFRIWTPFINSTVRILWLGHSSQKMKNYFTFHPYCLSMILSNTHQESYPITSLISCYRLNQPPTLTRASAILRPSQSRDSSTATPLRVHPSNHNNSIFSVITFISLNLEKADVMILRNDALLCAFDAAI